MYFCPNCNNVFDITKGFSDKIGGKDINDNTTSQYIKDSPTTKKGGANVDINKIIKNILDKEDINENILDNISIENIIKSNEYKNLKTTEKEYVNNKLHDLLALDKKKLLKENRILILHILFVKIVVILKK